MKFDYARRVGRISLPQQPEDVPWPTQRWPQARPGPEIDRARLEAGCERLLASEPPAAVGATHALLVVHRGQIVAEGYDAANGPEATLPSWSMAKSVLHALVGIAVRLGGLRLDAPAGVAAWGAPDDPRRAITLDQLLRMTSGVRFDEEYTDLETSSTLQMLFGDGKDDMAAFAAGFPAIAEPDAEWCYSSGSSNIVSALLGAAVGGGEAGMRAFMQRELTDPLGMTSADPRFDAAGTWIASSFLFATARDFARFGLLCLRDGVWEGRRILPEGWIDYGRTPTAQSGGEYGAHFWLALDGSGTFSCNGFRGQYTVMVPERDLVLVRLGTSMPDQKRGSYLALADLIECFPKRV
jgi:CubicO group peptidase (beta-lactamase class C family)